MSVKRMAMTWAAVLAVGCGPQVDEPQDWMIGVFSSRTPSIDDERIAERWYFEEGGVLRKEILDGCSSMPRSTIELEWKAVDENRVRAATAQPDGSEAFVLERLDACDAYRIYWEAEGTGTVDDPVYRGEICLRQHQCPGPDGENIDCGCAKEYCDEPPPPLACAEK